MLKEFFVTYILLGEHNQQRERVSAFSSSEAIRTIKSQYGFSNVTIKEVTETN